MVRAQTHRLLAVYLQIKNSVRVHAKLLRLCLTLCDPLDCSPPGSVQSYKGFSMQEYWSEFSCPPPGDLPDSGIEPTSHVSCVGKWDFTTSATWEAQEIGYPIANPWRVSIVKIGRIKYTEENQISTLVCTCFLSTKAGTSIRTDFRPPIRITLVAVVRKRLGWTCRETGLVTPAKHLEEEWADFNGASGNRTP